MRVAYLTTYDPNDRSQWSGLGFAMAESLRSNGVEVVGFGPFASRWDWLSRQKERFYRRLFAQTYESVRDPFVSRAYARQIERRLSREQFDAVLSPGAPILSHLRCRVPVVCWSDATLNLLMSDYPRYQRLCRETRWTGERAERQALRRCDLILMASAWAAESVQRDYGVPSERVKIVPFGANLLHPPSYDDVQQLIAARPTDTCRLVSIGQEWERKGMPRAVALATRLNQQGLRTSLSIVGCQPPAGTVLPDYVRLEGFIDKRSAAGELRLANLLSAAHFHVLFSQAECFGIVFAEANAFGVPNLATDVGGVSSAVVNGRGGQCFSPETEVDEIANFVASTLGDTSRYRQMAEHARQEFDQRLNWRTIGAEVKRHLETLLPGL